MGHTQPPMKARIIQQHNTEMRTHYVDVNEAATPSEIRLALERRGVSLAGEHQFVANGKEMSNNDTVGALGEFFFRSNAIYVRPIKADVCREWQRTGRCPHGGSCNLVVNGKALGNTHKPEFSPRYIAHHAVVSPSTSPSTSPALSPGLVSLDSSNSSTPEPMSTQPQHNAQMPICTNWATHGCCPYYNQCFFAATHTVVNLPREHQAAWQQQQQYRAPILLSSESRDTSCMTSWRQLPPPDATLVHPHHQVPPINQQSTNGMPWGHQQVQMQQFYQPQQQSNPDLAMYSTTNVLVPPTKFRKADTWQYYQEALSAPQQPICAH